MQLRLIEKRMGNVITAAALTFMLIVPIIFLLAQTEKHPPVSQHVEFVLPKACIKEIAMPENFACRGIDEQHLRCASFVLTVVKNCGRLEIVK